MAGEKGCRRRGRTLGAAVVAAAGAALVAGMLPPAPATAVPITPQPETTWETGVVSAIADGDTVHVDVLTAADPGFIAPSDPALRSYCVDRLDPAGAMPADGRLRGCRVRLVGLQTPEVAGASGGSALAQCRASAASAALTAVLKVGTPVQLRSISVRSVENDYSGGRLARAVYYEVSPGQWVDAGRAVAASGQAMWFPHAATDPEKPEYTHNAEYRQLIDAAAAAGKGLWSPDLCGPSAPASVRLWVVSNPIGDDAGTEHVIVRNDADTALDISGWTLRDSSLSTFTFPAGTVIGPHDHLRVFTGTGPAGVPTPRDLRFGAGSQMFGNWDPAAGYFLGDGAYLYDAQPGWAYGNLRAHAHYPCQGSGCADPLVGQLRLGTISYDPAGTDTPAAEFVEVVNASAAPLPLAGYGLERQGSQFPFPPSMVLAPGATLRVVVGAGVDDATTLHMGRTDTLLSNAGDHLAIARLDHAPVDCRAWGSFTCAGMPVSGPLRTPSSPPAATSSRPGAPTAVTAAAAGRRVVVAWRPPAPNGSTAVTKYRAKVYKKVGKKLKYRTTCTAKGTKLTCRTGTLAKRSTYVVKVAARTKKGYGPSAAPVSVRIR